MTDATRAAERLRIYASQPNTDPGATWQHGDAVFGACTVMADIMLLADEYLQFLDDSPITPTALAAMGFVIRNGSWWLYVGGDVIEYGTMTKRIYLNDVAVRGITTIGALRMLVAALTFEPTTPQGNEQGDGKT